VDEIDIAITKILLKNARISFREIAKQLGISPQMVIRRYNKLKATFFAYSSVTVNFEKLGFKASVAFSFKIAKEKQGEIGRIYEKITSFPNVIVANKVLGTVDMFCLVPVRSFEEIFEFQNCLSEIEGIEEIEMTIYKPHKNWPRQLYSKLLDE